MGITIRWEHALLTKILDDGAFREAKDLGITADHFYLPDTRSGWNWVAAYYAKHGATPSREAFADGIRGFTFQANNDPLTALVERVQNHRVYNDTKVVIEDAHALVKNDPIEGAQALIKGASKIRALLTTVADKSLVDITKQTEEERAAYERRKECDGILGKKWPWEHLNKMTHGIMDGGLNIFYARPGNMKTWLLLYVAMYAHYYLGLKPIIFTREMTKEDLRRRIIAMFAGVDYTRYMEGRLNSDEEQRWNDALEAFAESQPLLIGMVDGIAGEAADAILDKVDESGANFLVIDSIYEYGNRETQLIAEFITTIKRGILSRNLPCVGATQRTNPKSSAGAKEASGDDVGYSDSLYQAADVLIHVKLIKEDKRLYLSIPKVREGIMFSRMSVWAKPAYDFSQAYVEEEGDGEHSEDVGPEEAPIQ